LGAHYSQSVNSYVSRTSTADCVRPNFCATHRDRVMSDELILRFDVTILTYRNDLYVAIEKDSIKFIPIQPKTVLVNLRGTT